MNFLAGLTGLLGLGGAPSPQEVINEIKKEAQEQFEKSKALHQKSMATWQ